MRAIYNINSDEIETVYTYMEWLNEYNRREQKRKMKKRKEMINAYLSAVIMISIPLLFILHWLIFGY